MSRSRHSRSILLVLVAVTPTGALYQPIPGGQVLLPGKNLGVDVAQGREVAIGICDALGSLDDDVLVFAEHRSPSLIDADRLRKSGEEPLSRLSRGYEVRRNPVRHADLKQSGVVPFIDVEEVIAISGVVAALAACVVLAFAFLTVREARSMRRETVIWDQRRRLEDMAGLLQHIGELSRTGGSLGLARLRLAASLNASTLDLPACREIVVRGDDADQAKGLAAQALNEIVNALSQFDPEPHAIRITAAWRPHSAVEDTSAEDI